MFLSVMRQWMPSDAIMNLKSFLIVDFKDMSNWIALAIAIPLLIWGVTILMRAI